MIVAARQRVEARDHAGRSKKFDPIDRPCARRDQVQRRKPVLGDDAAERGRAAGKFGKPAGADGSFEMPLIAVSPEASPTSTTRESSASARASLIAVWLVFIPGTAPNTASRSPAGAGMTQVIGDARDRAGGNAGSSAAAAVARERRHSRRQARRRPTVGSSRAGAKPSGGSQDLLGHHQAGAEHQRREGRDQHRRQLLRISRNIRHRRAGNHARVGRRRIAGVSRDVASRYLARYDSNRSRCDLASRSSARNCTSSPLVVAAWFLS